MDDSSFYNISNQAERRVIRVADLAPNGNIRLRELDVKSGSNSGHHSIIRDDSLKAKQTTLSHSLEGVNESIEDIVPSNSILKTTEITIRGVKDKQIEDF